jgi:hypothetical protein
MRSAGRNSFTPQSKAWLSLSQFSQISRIIETLRNKKKKNLLHKFNETPTNGLVSDTDAGGRTDGHFIKKSLTFYMVKNARIT